MYYLRCSIVPCSITYVLCLVTISHHCITSHIRMRTDSVNTCYPGLVVLSECSVPCSVVDSL